ncbi:unnamed protein product [Trichogramma brassicae]|uniref:Reverse transcriptase domain-containing protein n=1 Tax=Trichogramma brassicae TaxID=86971 RepID=A0A6H5IMJ4_9HYME|nr:unnamed protein product [Trichogramma brassicae]
MECCRRRRFRRRPSNQLDNPKENLRAHCFHCQTPGHRAAYCPGVTCQICGHQGLARKFARIVRHSSPRMSPKMEEVARAEVTRLAAEGFIEQSASDWCSAPVLVKKQDGSYRFCIDYRDLNKVTVQDQYPIPNMDGILDKLRKARYLSKVDLKNAYHQIPMEANSKKYTAFAIPGSGLWHYTRMPFGLCNAPRTFQRLIDSLFGPEFEPNIFGYLDDIIVATDTFEEHLQWLKSF